MNKNDLSLRASSMLIAAFLLAASNAALGQESAYADLDACVKSEQIKLTAKGMAAGALAGFGAALFSGKKNDPLKSIAIGAAVGGAAGFATAYYTSIDTCQKLNPSWIPESNIVRDPSKSFKQVNKENNYKPKDGIVVQAKDIDMASSAKAGTNLDVTSTYDLMTPDGAETAIKLERKLFVITDGKETALPFPGNNSEEYTMAAGRNKDSVRIPISPDAKTGTVYRVEFSVAAGGKEPVVMTKKFTIA